MNVGSHSDEESSRTGSYDFARLERSVEFLLKEHQRLSGEHEALLVEFVDREHRISSLERRLETEKRSRATAVETVDKILGRLEQLQTSATAAAKAAL